MRMKECDVLVAGAGPAGSTAARFLAEAGLSVALVDCARFPRDKSCGDGFTPRTTRDLYALGMAGFLRERAFRVEEFLFHCAPARPLEVALEMGLPYPGHSYTISRSALDHELVRRAARAGALVLEGYRFVSAARDGGERWDVLLDRSNGCGERGVGKEGGRHDGGSQDGDSHGGESTVSAAFLVGADGARSAVARAMGLRGSAEMPRGVTINCRMEGVRDLGRRMEFMVDRELLPGHGWIFPLGESTANVGVAVLNYGALPGRVNVRRLWRKLLDESPSASVRLRGARMLEEPRVSVLPFHMFGADPVGEGFLLAGDAAGLVNPITGEGVSFALESGWLAARALVRAWPRPTAGALACYRRELHTLFAAPFRTARSLVGYTQKPGLVRAFTALFGGRRGMDTRMFARAYSTGVKEWRRLFPDDDGIFRI